MISGKAEEGPPPGDGLSTVILALPGVAKSSAERVNPICVLLM